MGGLSGRHTQYTVIKPYEIHYTVNVLAGTNVIIL